MTKTRAYLVHPKQVEKQSSTEFRANNWESFQLILQHFRTELQILPTMVEAPPLMLQP